MVFEHLAVRVVQLQVGRRHLAGERVFGFNLARDSITSKIKGNVTLGFSGQSAGKRTRLTNWAAAAGSRA